MKKYLSTLSLFIHSSFLKIAGVLALMGIAEAALFLKQCRDYLAVGNWDRFETFVDYAQIDFLIMLAFILVTVILCRTGTSFGSQTMYSVRRLAISEKSLLLMQAIYNTILYLFFWAFQVLIVYGLSIYYMKVAPADQVSNQSIFLAFYRSGLLHGLLPLSEVLLWIRNLLLLLGLGFAAAIFPYKQRRRGFHFSIFVLVLLSIFLFPQRIIGDIASSVVLMAASLITIGLILFDLYYWEEPYDS